MKKTAILRNIDAITLIVIATSCGSFTVWSMIVKRTEYYSLLACGFLFAIALHFIFSIFVEKEHTKNQKILAELVTESKNTILNSQRLTITSFEGTQLTEIIQNVDLYIAGRIKDASKCIYDLNWQDYQKNNNPRNNYDRKYSENAIDGSIKEFCTKDNVTYQEIFTFSDSRNYPKLKTHIKYGDNYSCAYFDNLEPLKKFPKIQFVVLDEKEVVFVSSAYGHSLCATRDEKIVEICCIYFKQAWDLSIKIKEEEKKHNDVIAEIKSNYNQ